MQMVLLVSAPAATFRAAIECSGEDRSKCIVQRNSSSTRRGVVAVGLSLLISSKVAFNAMAGTPYSQAQENMELGLLNGRIRPCPSDINPNCVSTSSRYGTFAALPWTITNQSSSTSPLEEIERAILDLEKNAALVDKKSSEEGDYLAMEVDGLFGRDVVEFLVRGQNVAFRSMAKNVIYVYPFTTPVTDFGRQQSRLKALEEKLGWGFPSREEATPSELYAD